MITFKLNKNQKLILGILGVVILVIGIYYIFIRPKKNIEGIDGQDVKAPKMAGQGGNFLEVSAVIQRVLLTIVPILGTNNTNLNILLDFINNLSSGSGNIGLNILEKINLLKTDGIFLGLFTIRNQKQNKELADEILKKLMMSAPGAAAFPQAMMFTELPELCIIDTDQLAEGVVFNNGIELPLLPQNSIVNLINSNPFIQINNGDSFIVNDECIQYTVISDDKDLGMAFDKFYENMYYFVTANRIPDPKDISNECEQWYPEEQPKLGIALLPELKYWFEIYYGNSNPNFNWNNVVANSKVLQDLINCRRMAPVDVFGKMVWPRRRDRGDYGVERAKFSNMVEINEPMNNMNMGMDQPALAVPVDSQRRGLETAIEVGNSPEIVSFVPTLGFLLLKAEPLYVKLELGGEIKEQIKYSHIAEFIDQNIKENNDLEYGEAKMFFNVFALLNNLLIDTNKQKNKFLFNLISPLLLYQYLTSDKKPPTSKYKIIDQIKNVLDQVTATTRIIENREGVIKLKVNISAPGPWLLVTNLLPINSRNKITRYKLSFSRDDKTYGPISKLFTDPTEKQITEEVIKGVNSISDTNKDLIITAINSKNDDIADKFKEIGNTTNSILKGQKTIKQGIKKIKLDIGDIKSDIGGIKANIESIGTDIGDIKANIDTIKLDIGDIKSDIGSIDKGIKALQDILSLDPSEEGVTLLDAFKKELATIAQSNQELEEMKADYENTINRLRNKLAIANVNAEKAYFQGRLEVFEEGMMAPFMDGIEVDSSEFKNLLEDSVIPELNKLDTLLKGQEEIKKKLNKIKNILGGVPNGSTLLDELSQQIQQLQASNTTNVDTIKAAYDQALTDLQNGINQTLSDISANDEAQLNGLVADIKSYIDTANADELEGINTTLSNIDSRLVDLDTKVTGVQETLDALQQILSLVPGQEGKTLLDQFTAQIQTLANTNNLNIEEAKKLYQETLTGLENQAQGMVDLNNQQSEQLQEAINRMNNIADQLNPQMLMNMMGGLHFELFEIKERLGKIEQGQKEIFDKIGEESTRQLEAYNEKIDELSEKLEELITAGLETTDVEIKEQIKNSEETLKAELRQLQNDKDLLLAEIKSANNLSDDQVRNIDINIENRTRGGGRGGGYMPQQPLVITQPSAPVIQQPVVAPQPVRVYDRESKDDSGVSMANVMLYALPSIAIVGIIYLMMNRMNKKK